jgi:hypothetical protein
MNIGTPESPNIIKIGAQCFDEEKKKFIDLFQEFCDVFPSIMRIFMVLILIL